MNILVTNDDGVNAPGLWALAGQLQQVANVLVVAPDREQTGVGTSITLHQPLRVKAVAPVIGGVETYSIEGTPADSVIIGTQMLWKDKVDMVVSGINEGPNLGRDVLVSGTVAAALQAYNCGLPALALSVAAIEDIHFEVAAGLTALLARQVAAGKLPRNGLLNINLPNLPLAEIEGIDITKLGDSGFTQGFAVNKVPGHYDVRRMYCWITPGATELKEERGTDIWAVRRNRISITPIHNRLTSYDEPRSLPGICSWLSQQLSSGSLPVSDHFID
ncbi:MAG: 5'/3'-nucleotidase SurE [Dehalococcoidia bacterium]|nr:5'/3'-nucleotidase SurE [Dehalococcoidia bacterium]